ncbi:hypothetical protein Bresa_03153|uniref:Intracellular septation protein A n=1 Tax=Brenneria salicis ATCC 15712 = DSM 30166 TaxID=714314 RepID=A0A366I1K7_9GAMM|nr:hypothetical protein [Brenneria salicis]NMN92812.1 hypothetical protein [Brenneria salicis ATCC 15712 = DSM 30166]RBP59742.1 hypothetical protein DES54_13630 [Brenneria salicis ATCC 15712 = DSM 30166]RLM29849.1 hypothetical protein BHG07_14020 [Brenneria salicis ATCC 15712 = DSM 30166]
MQQSSSITLWSYLLSRDAHLTIVLPIVFYHIAFWLGGAGIALLITALYSAVVEGVNRRKGALAIIALIMLSGGSHYLYLLGHTPFAIRQESVFLAVSGAISVVIVFAVYSLLQRPVVRTLAEQAMPVLKTLPVYNTPRYARAWHEVSVVWMLIFLLKALGIYALSQQEGLPMDAIVLACGWPITLLLIIFSFYWPRYRWAAKSIG